jgi:heparan-sulfate lyase
MSHRRSVFFVDGKYFVIVDEATGKADGWVNLHYQMPPGKTTGVRDDMHFHTSNEDGCNMKLQVFGPEGMGMKMEEGWVSSDIMKKRKRINANFHGKKTANEPIRFITVIVPKEEPGDGPAISASFIDDYTGNSMKLEVMVGKEKKVLEYKL